MDGIEALDNKRKRLDAMKTDFYTWAKYYFPEFFPKIKVYTVLISAELPDMFEKFHLVSVNACSHQEAANLAKNWLLNDLIIEHPYLSEIIDLQSFQAIKSCNPLDQVNTEVETFIRPL
ncbi:hypothetical protein DBR40_09045 [Pedobacter sp. KBW01]|uniref:hypothetical protein n=1 Tax=Pedobacter sp. KBW01 TaxID=2153364 RepID=UPI000F593C3E|nr:hypothetical protein [Pedobacter sp. KBW01]RQO78085.1 hypothetical protein DBR40_09045 [Pedobacter sp. KBW01]